MLDSLRRPISVAAFLVILSICAGCSERGPAHQLAMTAGFAAHEVQPADFISQSRGKALEYKSVGYTRFGKNDAPLDNTDLNKLKKSLETRRIRDNAKAVKIRAASKTSAD